MKVSGRLLLTVATTSATSVPDIITPPTMAAAPFEVAAMRSIYEFPPSFIEGPAFDSLNQVLYFTDLYQGMAGWGSLYRLYVDPNAAKVVVEDMICQNPGNSIPGFNGCAWHPDGFLLCNDFLGATILSCRGMKAWSSDRGHFLASGGAPGGPGFLMPGLLNGGSRL